MNDLKINETINAPRGSLILSSDSYIVEEKGWYQIVSPSRREASRNEVIFSEVAKGNEKEKIQEIKTFYKEQDTSFKWCTNHQTKPNDFGSYLKEEGFHSWMARGMCAEIQDLNVDSPEGVTIDRVDQTNLDEYLSIFVEGWKMNPDIKNQLVEDYKWALSADDKRFWYFLARIKGEPVGTAGFVQKEKSAYLVGGNVLERFRGKGFYKALIKERLEVIKELSIGLVTTGAREATSAPILEGLGFETVFKSEIFQYDF